MSHLLFVYGTLLQDGNTFADYLRQHCSYLTEGKIKGILFDIGEYPGLVIPPNSPSYVFGSVYRIDNAAETLVKLDEYEGVGADQEQPNLYTRQMIPVETDKDTCMAWVYIYNLSTRGLPPIPSGKYIDYLAQKKSPGS